MFTLVTYPDLNEDIIDALQELGFFSIGKYWIKVNIYLTSDLNELLAQFEKLNAEYNMYTEVLSGLSNTLEMASSTNKIDAMLKVERGIWPAKIVDIGIPAFIVPIKPIWALNLFDPFIASQDLFGGEPRLRLNIENVYYRSPRPQILNAPACILWYVSKGEGNYRGSMAIRACSYLDEVVIDKPKSIYKRYRRLGVYKWKDVYSIANKDIDKDIMAFRFRAYPEVFTSPIKWDTLPENMGRRNREKFPYPNTDFHSYGKVF